MGVDINISFKPKAKVKQLAKAFENFEMSVFKAVNIGGIKYENLLKANLTSGKFGIKTDSGRLRNSFKVKTKRTSSGAESTVGTNLVYARIHEKGGKINVTTKMSNFAWFKFMETQETMWKAIALSKGRQINIPAKHYMELTLRTGKVQILTSIEKALLNDFLKGIK